MAILLSFASCDSDNSASSEPNQITDIRNPSQAKTLVGTWKAEVEEHDRECSYYDETTQTNHTFTAKAKISETLVIDADNNVTNIVIEIITKQDGSEFNLREQAIFQEQREYEKREVTISMDKKTITQKKYSEKEPLSEYFADWKQDEDHYYHVTLTLSEDGTVLRITLEGKMYGEPHEDYTEYIRQ